MKEWSKKTTDFVETNSSPVKTTNSSSVIKSSSSPASLAGGDLSKSPMKPTSTKASLTSGSLSKSPVKTTSARISLTRGGSSQSLMKVSSSAPLSGGPALSNSLMHTANSPISLTGDSSSTVAASSSGAANVSTGLGHRVAAGAATTAPLAAGTVVTGIAAVFYGLSNMIKYGEHKKTGAQAAKDTVKGSAGLGVSTGLGVAAAHAVAGTALAFGSTVVVPISAGFATGYISMKIWNKIFFKGKETSKTK